jgi:hypothetical protein
MIEKEYAEAETCYKALIDINPRLMDVFTNVELVSI